MYWYIMQLWWLDVTTLDLSSANGTMAEWSKALESGDPPYLVRKGASSNLASVNVLFFAFFLPFRAYLGLPVVDVEARRAGLFNYD